MHCIHCGALLPESAKFCTACGQPVQAAPAEPAQPVFEKPEQAPAQETSEAVAAPVNASEGYKTANAQLPPSYSNPNYSSQPKSGSPAAAAPASNGLAIGGFVCSRVFLPIAIGVLTAIAGLILSIMGLNTAKKLPDKKGHGLAVAGIIISAIRIALILVAIFAILALMIRGIGYAGHEIISNWQDYVPYSY